MKLIRVKINDNLYKVQSELKSSHFLQNVVVGNELIIEENDDFYSCYDLMSKCSFKIGQDGIGMDIVYN